MSTLTTLSHALQSVYESGDTSYCRSSSQAFAPAAIPILNRIATMVGLPFNPELIPVHALDADGAHEAQRPTEAAVDKVVDLLPVDTALLSDEEFVLAEIGRVGLSCAAELQIEIPDVRHLPDWAHDLPWERAVSEPSKDRLHSEVEAGVYEYADDEIAFHHLVSFGLGRPSTLVGHAQRFAERKLYRPQTGVTGKGRRWLELTPPILQAADTSLMMEVVFDESGEFEDERMAIERALALLGEDERRYIDKRLKDQAVFSLLNGNIKGKKQGTAEAISTKSSPRAGEKNGERQADNTRAVDADKTRDSMSMGMRQ